ncbi:MAG TPA: PP2C family serine/threonine-protein phosphatase [Blastocatellia bacterium]|nr:PP2C family serine/threonine-protein phosphatase [Blastocatellia bacterium]
MNQTNLRVGAKSHTGNVRTENQDRMGRFPSPFGELYIVVDGMGGHKGGATAASMTVDGLEAHLRNIPQGTPPEQALQIAAQRTNAEIYQKANDGDPETANMGATLVLGLVTGARLLIAHAGDSRAYLFRDGKLSRLMRDHSVVQRMIDHNMLTEEQARDHPDSNVITRAFGQKPEIELEVSAPFDLREGDAVLLCTDGLCGYVDDQTIERAISGQTDAQQITDALIDLALSVGGEDNVTVQFLQFGQRRRKAIITKEMFGKPDASESSGGNSQTMKIGLIAGGAVAVILIALYMTGLIPGFGSSTSNVNENIHANANHRNNRTHNTNQENPQANTNAVARPDESDGRQGPAPTSGGSDQGEAGASGQPLIPEDQLRKPVAIAIPPVADDMQKNYINLDVKDRKVLVILSASWIQSKGIYYRDVSSKEEAESLQQRLGYGKDQVKPMPDNLANDFQDYDIIIHP